MKILVSLLTASLLIMPGQIQAKNTWKSTYRKVLTNPHKELHKDCEYLETYNVSNISVGRYFLYDLNKDGTPELFLFGNKKFKGFKIAISYYNGRISSAYYEDFNRINKKQEAIITKGHFHGCGGSYVNEYHAIKVCGRKKELKESVYIDYDFRTYNIYLNRESHYGTKKEYQKLYDKYVKGAQKISKFKTYSVKDMRGLSKIDK